MCYPFSKKIAVNTGDALEPYKKPNGRQELENAYRDLLRGIYDANGHYIQLKTGLGTLNVSSNVVDVVAQLVDANDCFYIHAMHSHHPHTTSRPEFPHRAVQSGSAMSLRALIDTGCNVTRYYRGGRDVDLTEPDIPPVLFAAACAKVLTREIFILLSAYDAIGRTHFSFIRLAMFRLAARAVVEGGDRKLCVMLMELIERDTVATCGADTMRFVLSRRGRVADRQRGTNAPFPFTDLDTLFRHDDVELLIVLLDMGLDVTNIYGTNGGGYVAAKYGAINCLMELARRGIDVAARKKLVDIMYRPLLVEIAVVDVLWYMLEAVPHILYSCGLWFVIVTPRRAALVRDDGDSACLEFIDEWILARRAGKLRSQQDCEMFVYMWAQQKGRLLACCDLKLLTS